MNPQTLTNRVEILERTVERLAELPDRVGAVELQVSQLRTEMHVEFSAVRAEMRELNEDTRRELSERIDGLGRELRELNDDTRRKLSERIDGLGREMRELNEETTRELSERIDGLGRELRELNRETSRDLSERIADTGTHMRVLHEDVISRIALLDEHTNGPRRTRHPAARQPRKKRKLKD